MLKSICSPKYLPYQPHPGCDFAAGAGRSEHTDEFVVLAYALQEEFAAGMLVQALAVAHDFKPRVGEENICHDAAECRLARYNPFYLKE